MSYQRYVQLNLILTNCKCWHCFFFFFKSHVKIEFRTSRKPASTIGKICTSFRNSDLPTGTLRLWQALYLLAWYQYLGTLKNPWSLSEQLPAAQHLWDVVFPDNTQTLAGMGEPIFYLVWLFYFILLVLDYTTNSQYLRQSRGHTNGVEALQRLRSLQFKTYGILTPSMQVLKTKLTSLNGPFLLKTQNHRYLFGPVLMRIMNLVKTS